MLKFGLLGEKLSHSYSPQIHSKLADYQYLLFEKNKVDVEGFLKQKDFDGLNVTIPYKQTVIPFCDVLSDTVKKVGSVNTIIKQKDGLLFGDNTDYYGFKYLITTNNINVKDKKTIVLGSGGSSRTVCSVLKDLQAAQVIVISRGGKDNYNNIDNHHDADVIVNTTPVGMYPNNGKTMINLEHFHKVTAVIDLIYNPAKTKLLLDAQKRGIKAVNGMVMLVAQAKKSCELFTGRQIDQSIIDKISEDISAVGMNIVLIGMPGSGKTSVGKQLSNLTHRKFIDTDIAIEKKYNKRIVDIINTLGEETFRNYETEVLEETCKLSGCIISTGGGVVTMPRNLDLLRQNSIIIFLNRDLCLLETKNRPLSKAKGIDALAQQRLPLYRSWMDYEFDCIDIAKTAQDIQFQLKL